MKNWSIRRQILALGATAFGVAMVLSVVAVAAAWMMAEKFERLGTSSKVVSDANLLLEDEIESRAEAMKFRFAPSPENATAVRMELAEVIEILPGLRMAARKSGALDVQLPDMETVEVHAATFEQLVELQEALRARDADLHAAGLAARASLAQLMEGAFERGDAAGAYYAGRAQQAFLLSRLAIAGVMHANSPEQFSEAESWYGSARTELSRLDFILMSDEDRALKKDVLAHFESYWAVALDAVKTKQKKDQTQQEFETAGAAIARIVDDAVDALSENSLEIATSGTASARLSIGLVGFAAAVSILILLVLSRRISGGIVTELDHSVRQMQDLAGGNLSTVITRLDAATELGEMARTLETFRQTALESKRLTAEISQKDASERQAAVERQKAEEQRAEEGRKEIESARQKLILDLSESLGAITSAAARGEFSARIEKTFGDEMLDGVARSINAMMDAVSTSIGETARVLDCLADGDLTERMHGSFQGIFSELEHSLTATSETLTHVVKEILTQSDDMASSTEAMLDQADKLAARAEQQAAALEQTSAAMEQMSATARSSADAASDATTLARSATVRVDEAGAVVSSAVDAMSDIRSASDRIKEIVSVIDGIAFQTNLLALNASVEAARAGSAGKGFAVVATEVRALAQRSGAASKDIKTLIDSSSEQIGRGVELVEKTGLTLEDIVKSVREMADTMETLTSAAREQATGVTEVTGAVTQMDTITQQNATLADQSRADARSLGQKMSVLRNLVNRFQVSPNDTRIRSAIAAE